jgi:hypothetical protein
MSGKDAVDLVELLDLKQVVYGLGIYTVLCGAYWLFVA